MRKIFSYIFIFIFVFLTCYFNVSAISLRNYGGITGYGSANPTGRYSCPGKTWGDNPGYAGVIEIADSSRTPYYCSECDAEFPNSSWGGSSTFYDYSLTGTCYYSCSNPNTGSYATTQHNIWDIMKNASTISCNPSNTELGNACGGSTVYILTEYGYSNYQNVVSLSQETPSQTIYVSKVCNNGLTGTFEVELVRNNTVYKKGSISCGDSGKTIFGSSLPTGTYLIREVQSRSDVLYDTEGEITLTSGESKTATFTNSLKKGDLKVNKVCKTGVSGTFKVGIYKDGTFVEDAGTKEISCGSNVTFNLPVGVYSVKEIGLDSKYNVEYSSSSVTVKYNETSEVTVTNSLKPGKVTVTKECTGYITNNQKFKITLNNVTKEFSCNTSYTWDNLTPGDYTLTEDVTNLKNNLVQIKIGNNAFVTGNSTSVKVLPNEEVKVIVKNKLEAGGIVLTKVDADTKKPIEGVKFKLYFINGNNEEEAKDIYGNLLGIQTTTKEGKIAFQNLPYGKYKIVEVENPEEGYVIAESQTVIIDKDNAYYKSNFENKRIKLIINKTNIDGSKELENAKFNILDKKTKETYKEIEITKDNKTLILKPGEYIITEVVAPTGYQKLFDTIEIKVDEKGKITLNSKNDYVTLDDNVLTIKNDTRKVSISKADITTNKELEGAELVLIKKTGETEVEVIKWTSTKTPYRIELEAGTYILKELKVPTGYKNDPIVVEFSVDENGVVTIISETSKYYKSVDNEITIYNEKPIDVPDTGKTMKIVLIVAGALLIGGGSYLTFKYGKRKEC